MSDSFFGLDSVEDTIGSEHNGLWIGSSVALKQLQTRLNKYAAVDFPVLISGEKGTGKTLAARYIHQLSSRSQRPFIEHDCVSFESNGTLDTIKQSYQAGLGGTLFLKNLNALPSNTLHKLSALWEVEYMGNSVPVRIICSTSELYSDKTLRASAAPWLPVTLPTLEDRKQDIRALVDMFLEKFKGINSIALAPECYAKLLGHVWRDNVKGLERAIAIVSVMAEGKSLSLQQLAEILPELDITTQPSEIPGQLETFHSKKTEILPRETDITDLPIRVIEEESLTANELIRRILDNELDNLPTMHNAVRNSLMQLAKHYSQKITLEQVAKLVFVSAPHLSFLYRKHLGMTFKQLLLQVRIEKSKRLLRHSKKLQVTHISYEVGFHDLSHFEKVFRKFVGIKPLQFRQQSRS